MIDMHSHILYGVDDGSGSRSETIEMLNIAVEEGIETIVATPHYIIGCNNYTKEELIGRYNDILDLVKENKIAIDIKLGNELFADSMLPQKVIDGDCFTLAGTDYVLLEFSKRTTKQIIENLIYQLNLNGYKVIIAHPERTFDIKGDLEILIELMKKGCLFQMNTGSLTGVYGDKVYKAALEMLDRNMIHIVSTDAHTNRRRSPKLRTAYKIISDRCGQDNADKLCNDHARQVLNNETIEYVEPEIIKNIKWFRLNMMLAMKFKKTGYEGVHRWKMNMKK